MSKIKLFMAAAACSLAAGAVSAQDHPVDSDKNIAPETERARTVRDNQEAKLEQQRDASSAASTGSSSSMSASGASGSMSGSTMGTADAGASTMGSSTTGSSMASGTGSTMGSDMSSSASTSTAAGNMYSSTTPAATTRTVSNGPVADTPENRAKYGQPMSRAGKRTAARGN